MKRCLCLVLLVAHLVACNSVQAPPEQVASSVEKKDTSKHDLLKEEGKRVIDSLYKNVHRLKGHAIEEFSFQHSIDKVSKIVTLNCTAKYEGILFGYTLRLKDTGGTYQKNDFTPSDEFLYSSSNAFLNNSKVQLNTLPKGDTSVQVHPLNVWYGKDFGPVARVYKLSDRNIFLIRGLNFYCNGSHCTNFKVIVLQQYKDNRVSADYLNFPGIYPYVFDAIDIFLVQNDSVPKMFIIKKGHQGNQVADFEIIDL